MSDDLKLEAADPLACVEHGIWTPIPVPPPQRPLVLKLADVDPEQAQTVKKQRVLAFHAVGCTGQFDNHEPGTQVARAMTAQINAPGQDAMAIIPSFLFHLGDVVYKFKSADEKPGQDPGPGPHDQEALYADQFYTPFAQYPRSIFAIAGNHDGKVPRDEQGHVLPGKEKKSAIRHFLKNFCDAPHQAAAPYRGTGTRSTMTQPYPYWVLEAPGVRIIGLYSNVANGGQLDDPWQEDQPQFNWLVETLAETKGKAADQVLILAIHYPPYSGAANFGERGEPNLGATTDSRPLPRRLDPLATILQRAYRQSERFPDAVVSAHAHLYQRITYTHGMSQRQIPYLIVGCGGHTPIEKLSTVCAKPAPVGVDPMVPVPLVMPPGRTLPESDEAKVVAYDDEHLGFLRLTVDLNTRRLAGTFFSVGMDSGKGSWQATGLDSFTLDLDSHRVR